MLHIVNKSPLEKNSLASCLRVALEKGGTILLIEDGVYAATRGCEAESQLRQAMEKCTVAVLQPDLEARGMLETVMDGVRLVDYGGFVDLVAENNTVQSWL